MSRATLRQLAERALACLALFGACGEAANPLDETISDSPLLASEPELEHTCKAEEPIARLYTEGWLGGTVLNTGAGWSLFSAERVLDVEADGASQIRARRLDARGIASLPRELARVGRIDWHFGSVATAAGKTALAWAESDAEGRHVALAVLDELGALVREPVFIGEPHEGLADVRIAAAKQGWALWIVRSSDRAIWMRVDDAGRLLAGPRDVVHLSGGASAASFVRIGRGYAATFATLDGSARLLFLDDDGVLVREPWSGGKRTSGHGTLVRGDELIFAYTSSFGSDEIENVATELRLARFDQSGNLLGTVRSLQEPRENWRMADPVLVSLGDDIALSWIEGRRTYACRGLSCIADNSIEVVVLDGDDWQPRSRVVELPRALADGELSHPRIDWDGERLLVLSDLAWHGTADAASAIVSCD